jgi:DNA-binding SARP family transcriptional activator
LKWLRAVLPDDAIETTTESVRLAKRLEVLSDSADVERRVVEAARQQGSDKIKMLQTALMLLRSGEFLSGLSSEWIVRRREQLHSLLLDAETAMAHEYLLTNRPVEAGQVLQHVLATDPYRESAWQLRMLIALDLNDRDALLAAYRACAAALKEIDVSPSDSTRRLLKRLA